MASVSYGVTGISWADSQTPGGATTSSELLDHYEEGSWTPSMIIGSTTINNATANNVYGYYLRIGALLQIAFYWYRAASVTESGAIFVGNWPFSVGGAGTAGAYQSITGGYVGHSDAQYGDTGGGKGSRWQHNSSSRWNLYAEDSSHDGAGTLEAHGYGTMRIDGY